MKVQIAAGLGSALLAIGLASGTPAASVPRDTSVPAASASSSARALLLRLPVAREKWSSSYDRGKFRHWVDTNRDCQDTRAEVLIAESRADVTFTDSRHCTVSRGKWYSKYDGRTWRSAGDVDVDHMVPLKEAWESGARNWSAGQRERYANDLGFGASLIAVTDNVNQSKGDRDPVQWLPSRARCAYAKQWVKVKYRWSLTIDPAEKHSLANILSGSCGSAKVKIPTRAH